jgi:hypothetical protein
MFQCTAGVTLWAIPVAGRSLSATNSARRGPWGLIVRKTETYTAFAVLALLFLRKKDDLSCKWHTSENMNLLWLNNVTFF